MYLTSLEMIGFKSFASRTVIELHPGVMAVVGPNGCGKTNIVDAVRWVLGEQRSGALRADRMESVIFNGTPGRRPLGMAEVTLTIENTRDILPTPYTEVAITRRLFRSGESEYLINRSPVRLRDINDMFADTGLGNNAYSIIELSMVEGIITGPSDMRRVLLEEAAGVAKYKARRQATARRLESTREKLDRIEDIYREVEKHYRTLKRQASRARRHQALAEAIRLKTSIELSSERLDIRHKREPLETRLTELENELDESEETATRATSELLSLEGQELSILDKSKRSMDAMKHIERRESELEREHALTQQRIKFLEMEAAKTDQHRLELTTKIQNAQKLTARTEKDAESLKKQIEKIDSKLQGIEDKTGEISAELEAARKKTSEKRRAEAEAERQLSIGLGGIGRYDDEIRRFKDRKEALEKQVDELNGRIDGTEASLASARDLHQGLDEARKAEVARYDKAMRELEAVRRDHAEALSDRARAAAELEAVRTALQAHRQRIESPRQLPAALQKIVEDEGLRTVADRVECKPEHRAATAIALGRTLEALDRQSLESVTELSASIGEDERAALRLPIETAPDFQESNPTLDGCIHLPSLIENEGEFGNFLKRHLADVMLAPDFKTLARLAPEAVKRRLRIVTPEGEMLEPDNVFYIGKINPGTARVGWLTELHELEKRVTECGDNLQNVENRLKAAAEKLAHAEATAEEARTARQQSEDNFIESKRRINSLELDIERYRQRRGELTSEIDHIRTERKKLPEQNRSREKSEELQAALKKAARSRREAERELRTVEKKRLEAAEQRAAITAESARLNERSATMQKSIERYRQEAQAAETELANLKGRLAEGASELQRVRNALENISAQIELLNKEKSDVKDTLEDVRNLRDQLKQKRAETTARLNTAQDRQKEVLKEHSRLEAETIALRERLREINRRLEEEAGINPKVINESWLAETEAKLEDLGMADLSLDKLRTRLQSIGPVNMLALDELPEVENRYKFLTDQKADLENGIEILKETIDRINHEARRVFRDTFDTVNDNFQEIFRALFEGGEACLMLQDGDPLEAEINILATPSGKKLQALSMLSGGEKALTAIALLFAIYRVRPSPFCILDEVDAPLDDANILRFNQLIRQYAVETQFLIVTHNKRTMEAADCLFGVTLGEDGTSKMVSVKIDSGDAGEN